jgi:hypothetical protein
VPEILNVHPSVAVKPPGPTTSEPFAPGTLYEFKVDTDGDAIADIAYSVQFLSTNDGKQAATLRCSQGTRAAGVYNDGEVIVDRAPVSVEREALVTKAGDYRVFFGWHSDRFVGVFAHELEHAGGYTNRDAMRVARTLLPDIPLL